ncbi:hypothetical protein LTR08_008103 [Meristemomyces frigidus]|nr:hypothetical protein LTR08_008103 [Meristemomyces frigidus]
MQGEWLIRGHIDTAAFLFDGLALQSPESELVDFRMAYLPVYRPSGFRVSGIAQGVIHTLPAMLCLGEASRCFANWQEDFEQARGVHAARDLLCFLDAIAAEVPKVLKDFRAGDFEGVLSEPALRQLERSFEIGSQGRDVTLAAHS